MFLFLMFLISAKFRSYFSSINQPHVAADGSAAPESVPTGGTNRARIRIQPYFSLGLLVSDGDRGCASERGAVSVAQSCDLLRIRASVRRVSGIR